MLLKHGSARWRRGVADAPDATVTDFNSGMVQDNSEINRFVENAATSWRPLPRATPA